MVKVLQIGNQKPAIGISSTSNESIVLLPAMAKSRRKESAHSREKVSPLTAHSPEKGTNLSMRALCAPHNLLFMRSPNTAALKIRFQNMNFWGTLK